MLIESIDLYGEFILNGSTGSDGQVLTFDNNGGFTWGTASTGEGGGGPTSSYAKTDGYNYVICETVNTNDPAADALTNGTNLLNAYTQAKNLNVGGLSSTNRVSVLLMPGDYDLGDTGQFQLDTSYVDIVGVSTNPYHAILRSSSQYATLQYTNPIDSALRNICLKQGLTLAVDDDGGNGDGSYLRWDNVFIDGYAFIDISGTISGFTNIYGEFKNIKILDNSFALCTLNGSIDAIFENIIVKSGGLGLSIIPTPENQSLTLSGTFSYIVVESSATALNSYGNIQGTFKNIRGEQGSSMLNANFNYDGTFENIESFGSSIFGAGNNIGVGHIAGVFRNIKAGSGFLTYDYIDGIFENLEMSGGGSDVFSANGTISGTFSNITIGDVEFVYRDADTICGTFENIKIGNVSSSAFRTSVDVVGVNPGKLYGTFRNIEIGNVDDHAFSSQNLITGVFENIKIGDMTDTTSNSSFYTEWGFGYIDGYFKNIEIGDSYGSIDGYFFTSGATLSGTFSDIRIGSATSWGSGGIRTFVSSKDSSSTASTIGTYENIEVGDTSYLFYGTYGDLDCEIDNLKSKNSTFLLCARQNVYGTYSNIKCYDIQSSVFQSEYGRTNINLDNFYSDYIFSSFVETSVSASPGTIEGKYKNIYIGYSDNIFAVQGPGVSGGLDIDGIYENIEVKSFGQNLYKGSNSIRGTYSDFRIGDGTNMFQTFNGTQSGYYKNLLIGSVSSGLFSSNFDGVIDNLNTISGFGINYGIFRGKMINSRIVNKDPNAFAGFGRIQASITAIFENNTIINDPNQAFSIEYTDSPGFPVVPDVQAVFNTLNCSVGGVDVNVIGGNNAISLGI
jgi:hypothetical protein